MKKLKTYKSARGILTHALADIQDGHWCKGMLGDFGKIKHPWADRAHRLGEDEVSSDPDPGEVVELRERPMGCAIGLVSMYGGIGHGATVRTATREISVFVPEYPDNGSPDGVKRAVLALYKAIPRESRNPVDDESNMDALSEAITSYNDRDSTKRAKAEKWFGRALESL